MKLGIFDSGIGGEAVAIALRQTFPDADIITVNDREHLPYGDKSQDEVIRLTDSAIQPLLESNCDIVILALYRARQLLHIDIYLMRFFWVPDEECKQAEDKCSDCKIAIGGIHDEAEEEENLCSIFSAK